MNKINTTVDLAKSHLRDNAKPSVIRADLIKVIRLFEELSEQSHMATASKSEPPKPQKDREIHLGGFSRHKRD